MAKKGQTFKKYDLAFKQKILMAHREGYSISYLAKTYEVPKGTITSWDQINRKYGGLEVVKRGRPKGVPLKDYQERYEILKKFQDFLDRKGPGKK